MKIDPDVSVPIVYGRPRYLVPMLIVAAAGALLAVVIGYATYGRVDSASREDVLGNRAVTEKLAADTARREADNASHRERNEEAHSCIAELVERLLALHGDRTVYVDADMPASCAEWTHAGTVPPPTTSTTTTRPRRRTTTPTRHRTTTTRPHGPTTSTTAPDTAPPTTTTPCPTATVPNNGTCVTAP